ncbi:MAG: 30S ribosomal protein S6 [Dehalococcoidia bacterium]|nr:30S ribosomal protein S6 [Chloroflexota bacterium]MBT9159360.1 30S ribosomal protein S6 [Chloroflexota bacterium]MBT9162110.1 30S ribosomal protein S6 [Chloroflexota bacterium]
MRSYELTVIIDPEIAEEDVPQTMEKLTAIIARSGGNINEVNRWGRRKLTYPIEHRGEGNYVMMKLELEPGKVSEFEGSLNLAEEYLRHLLVRLGD